MKKRRPVQPFDVNRWARRMLLIWSVVLIVVGVAAWRFIFEYAGVK